MDIHSPPCLGMPTCRSGEPSTSQPAKTFFADGPRRTCRPKNASGAQLEWSSTARGSCWSSKAAATGSRSTIGWSTTMSSRRQFLLVLAAATSSMGLAACSGAATPAAAPTTSAAPTAVGGAAPSGNPITIGVAISTTGSNGDTGTYQQQGYQMWAEKVNSAGGLLGRPVKFTFYDDQSDPTTSSRLYEKLITQDKVDLVLGPYASNVTAAVAQVTE